MIFRVGGTALYVAILLICVCQVNWARDFWQMFMILSIVNLADRFLTDDYRVGHVDAWTVLGTEDMKPYLNGRKGLESGLRVQ